MIHDDFKWQRYRSFVEGFRMRNRNDEFVSNYVDSARKETKQTFALNFLEATCIFRVFLSLLKIMSDHVFSVNQSEACRLV